MDRELGPSSKRLIVEVWNTPVRGVDREVDFKASRTSDQKEAAGGSKEVEGFDIKSTLDMRHMYPECELICDAMRYSPPCLCACYRTGLCPLSPCTGTTRPRLDHPRTHRSAPQTVKEPVQRNQSASQTVKEPVQRNQCLGTGEKEPIGLVSVTFVPTAQQHHRLQRNQCKGTSVKESVKRKHWATSQSPSYPLLSSTTDCTTWPHLGHLRTQRSAPQAAPRHRGTQALHTETEATECVKEPPVSPSSQPSLYPQLSTTDCCTCTDTGASMQWHRSTDREGS
eukprot:1161571-Pelagomonas_calceolata.AAC.9